jgi:hypothetical protein
MGLQNEKELQFRQPSPMPLGNHQEPRRHNSYQFGEAIVDITGTLVLVILLLLGGVILIILGLFGFLIEAIKRLRSGQWCWLCDSGPTTVLCLTPRTMAFNAGVLVLWNGLFMRVWWKECVEIVVMMRSGQFDVQGVKSV